MKKVLFYTDTPQIGGAELQMFLLAKFLNKEEFTPIIACSNYPELNNWCENLRKEGIEVIRMEVKSKHDPKHLTLLKEIIKEKGINIIHAHVWNPASCRYSYFAAKALKIPLITTEHDPFKLSTVKRLFKKSVLPNVAKIIAISTDNKAVLSELYPKEKDKIQVIHNGIDITWWQSQLLRFTEDDRKRIKKNIFFAKEDTFIITCVAELHERKGQKYLIAAISKVAEKYPNIKLVLVGEGPALEDLKKFVKNRKLEAHVTFTGRLNDIPQILKSSNIFALPSRREGFGLVNLEAMLTPLPVVASRIGGIPDVVTEQTGILVQPENDDELAKAILILIEHPEISEKLAEAGKWRVKDHFTAEKMAEEYEKAYREL